MSAIITKAVYEATLEEQKERTDKIQSEKVKLAAAQADLASNQSILAGNPGLIAAGNSQIASLNAQITVKDAEKEEAKKAVEEAEEAEASEAAIAALQAIVDGISAELETLTTTKASTTAAVETWTEELAAAPENIESANNEIDALTIKIKELQDSYDAWFAINGPIITQYQAEQDARNDNIDPIDANSLFGRELNSIQAQTVVNNSTSIKAILASDLAASGEKETEYKTKATEEGATLADAAGYVNAEKARDKTRAVIWSTLEAASRINAAAASGQYTCSFATMSSTCATLLINDGYNLNLAGDPSTFSASAGKDLIVDVIVSWNLRTPPEA